MKLLAIDIETVPHPAWSPPKDCDQDTARYPVSLSIPVVVSCFGFVTSPNEDSNKRFRLRRFTSEVKDKEQENQMLLGVEKACEWANHVFTFYGRGFDFPVLSARALSQGLNWGWWFERRKRFASYNEVLPYHVDLHDQLSDHGAVRGLGGLDDVLRMLGLAGKIEGMHGSKVRKAWNSGKKDLVGRYCDRDAFQTGQIGLKFLLLAGIISKRVLEETETEMVKWAKSHPSLKALFTK
jgi:predicted PolB exonuclease-like 3'-5' exonuclease